MKILIVEDDKLKRQFLECFLKSKGIETLSFMYTKPAINYVIKYSTTVDAIILDLGLTSYKNSDDYDFFRGLDLVYELTKKGIEIPILINSSTYINLEKLQKHHKNVKAQMNDDEYDLRQFVNRLKKKK